MTSHPPLAPPWWHASTGCGDGALSGLCRFDRLGRTLHFPAVTLWASSWLRISTCGYPTTVTRRPPASLPGWSGGTTTVQASVGVCRRNEVMPLRRETPSIRPVTVIGVLVAY